jgi:hypothetical protein
MASGIVYSYFIAIAEWNTNCDQVKRANGGYPDFWYEAVVVSGLSDKTAAGWGGDAQMKIVVVRSNPKLGMKEAFERVADLLPLELSRIMYGGDDQWRTTGPSHSGLQQLGVQKTDHILCGMDQGLGEKLFDCGSFEQSEEVRLTMASYWKSYASGMALYIYWYRLPA